MISSNLVHNFAQFDTYKMCNFGQNHDLDLSSKIPEKDVHPKSLVYILNVKPNTINI